MDRLSREARSRNMSLIRSENTAPERAVRSILHRSGFRFRLHQRGLPGRPDIVLARYRAVVFVHGCFWHRHMKCPFAYLPKSNVDFWRAKFERTVERDRAVVEQLHLLDWRVLVVWECELRDVDALTRRIAVELRGGAGKRAVARRGARQS